jgi:endonuclease/exonuclease/phosphatase family metal-dependent hydrolase
VRRIDGVFVSSGAKVCSARLVDSEAVHRASDHKPLVVEFDL